MDHGTNERDARLVRAGVTLTLAVAAAVVVTGIGVRGFWVDEMITLNSVRLGWFEMVAERMRRGHPPLYFALVKAWLDTTGRLSEVWLRLPSAVMWALAVGSFVPLAGRVLSRRAALMAVAVAALGGVGINHACFARMYSMVFLVSVWLLRAHWECVMAPSAPRRWIVVALIAAVAGALTSPSVFLLLAGLLAHAWLDPRACGARRPLVWAAAAAAMVYSPCLIAYFAAGRQIGPAASLPGSELVHLVSVVSGVSRVRDFARDPHGLQAARVLGGALTTAVLLTLALRWRSVPLPVRAAVTVVAVPFAIMALLTAAEKATGLRVAFPGSDRYLMAVAPAGALLTGWAVSQWIDKRAAAIAIASWAALVVVLAVGGWSLLRAPIEPFRDAMRVLRRLHQPGDTVVIIPREIAEGVRFYVPQAKIAARFPTFADADEVSASLSALPRDRTIWYIRYRDRSPDAVRVAREVLGPFHTFSGRPEPAVIDVLRFDPPH